MKIPELLAPAGDLERLMTAIDFGADAVYLGGKDFGLRANSKNFDNDDMARAVDYAHHHGKKVYVTANIFANDTDIEAMPQFFCHLEASGVDAAIVSDPGVFATAREAAPKLALHISTQANTTNARTVKFWHDLGASRVILARELSIEALGKIHKKLPHVELETFVHGAMCMSMSGRCLLSNYFSADSTRTRDANKGDCTQPCRFKYALVEQTRPDQPMPIYEDDRGTYIFNSKDLCLVGHLPALVAAGVTSLKIEGRMKTPYYVAVTVKTYRTALDTLTADPAAYANNIPRYIAELEKASHRGFTTGFALSTPDDTAQVYTHSSYIRTHQFIGVALEYDPHTSLSCLEQRGKFSLGDVVEILPKQGEPYHFTVSEMYDANHKPITSAPHARQIVHLRTPKPLSPRDILRKEA